MNQLTIQLACALLAMCAPFPIASARVQDPAASSPAVIDRAELGLVWTGERKKPDGTTERVVTVGDPAAIKKELAEIQVLIDVDRKLEEARTRLDDLHIRVTRLGSAFDYWSTLRDVALARAKLYEMLGDFAQALEATNKLFVTSEEAKAAPGYVFAAPSESALAQFRQAHDDPRVKELRDRLSKKTAGNGDADSTDKIARMVRGSLPSGGGAIYDLGPRALPELERLCASSLDEMPDNDPLKFAVQIGGPEVARFVLENFDRGGEIWKRRILRALITSHVFDRAGDWSFTADERQPPRLNLVEWVPVTVRLLLDASTQRNSLPLVTPLMRFDALTTELQAAVKSALQSSDANTARDFASALAGCQGRATVLPVLEAGLQVPNVEARGIAAMALGQYKRSDALLAAVGNSSARVRQGIANALAPRTINTPRYSSKDNVNYSQETFVPSIGPKELAILSELIADPDADVRAAAALAIARQPTKLADAVYIGMARDPDQRVREYVSAGGLDEPRFLELAEIRARESNPQLLQRFDNELQNMAGERGGAQRDPAKYLEVLQLRRQNTAVPLSKFSTEGEVVKAIAVASSSALSQLVKAAVEPDGEDLFPGVVGALQQRVGNRDSVANAKDVGIEVDRDTLAKLFVLANTKFDGRLASAIQGALLALPMDLSPSLLPIAEDPARPLAVRLRALQLSAANGGERAVDVLLALASSDDPMHWNSGEVSATLNSVGRRLPEPLATSALTRLVADSKSSENFVGSFGAAVVTKRMPSTELSDAILTRFLDSTENSVHTIVTAALHEVADRPQAAQHEWLTRAAKSRSPNFVRVAFRLIGEKHDRSQLGFLSDCLMPRDLNPPYAAYMRSESLESLTRYLDDEAAEVILKAAGAADDPEFRKKCFEALDTIRKYQEEKHRWDSRKTSQQAKDDAVRELVRMLDDPDAAVRAQTTRSLATLGAVEELPRIVKLLKDKDPLVRKAAQDALDALNAPAATGGATNDPRAKKD